MVMCKNPSSFYTQTSMTGTNNHAMFKVSSINVWFELFADLLCQHA